MTELRKNYITDEITKETAKVTNGGLEVNIQDQFTDIIDLYMCRETGSTNPSAGVDIDAKSIDVVSVTGAVIGDCIDIIEGGHVMQGIITSIVGTTISFNTPADYAFTTAAIVKFGEWNMNYDGSTTTLKYCVSPPAGVTWDVVRVIISLNDETEMDSTTFGGMTSLPNGVVLRKKNGVVRNIFVVNNNGGFAERAYDTSYDDRRSPQSEYGFTCRRTFGGQNKNGVVIRLNGDDGDELQMLIQDNLTPLTKMAVTVQGHIVE